MSLLKSSFSHTISPRVGAGSYHNKQGLLIPGREHGIENTNSTKCMSYCTVLYFLFWVLVLSGGKSGEH